MKDRIWPKAHRADRLNGLLVLDSRGMADGYVFAAVSQKVDKRLKLRIKKDENLLTYDLNNQGEFELFPLQLGDGLYDIRLYLNQFGKQYKNVGTLALSVKLKNPDAPFLVPNQYVNYSEDSNIVKAADELCEGLNEEDAFREICHYVESRFVYDHVKALRAKSGMLPNIEESMKKHMGICQDLAAVTVAMLRSQGIPAMLIIGHADKQYHAWVTALVNGSFKRFDPAAALLGFTRKVKYVAERFY